jgi:hypothetical protein
MARSRTKARFGPGLEAVESHIHWPVKMVMGRVMHAAPQAMPVQHPLSAAERSTAWSTCCTRSSPSNETSAQPSFLTAAYVLAASRPTITNISRATGKSKNRGATRQAWLWPAPVKPLPDHGDAHGCAAVTLDLLIFLAER